MDYNGKGTDCTLLRSALILYLLHAAARILQTRRTFAEGVEIAAQLAFAERVLHAPSVTISRLSTETAA